MDEKQLQSFEYLFRKKTKYDKVANDIYQFVGTKSNFTKFYNCVSRFRVVLIDKEKIDLESIKKIPLVKGIKWNGMELQIVIGGEVYKVTEAFEKLMNEQTKNTGTFDIKVHRKTFKEKFLGVVSGIIMPALPVIIAAGILKAIQAILVNTGALFSTSEVLTTNSGTTGSGLDAWMNMVGNYKAFSSIFMYIIAEIGLTFMGMFFCYNTVKYMGGNPVMGVMIGLGISVPWLLGQSYMFWDWNYSLDALKDAKGNPLELGLKLQGYGGSMLPQIAGGIIYVYVDRLNKKWVPKTIDIILRPAASFGLTIALTLGIAGPILGIFENLITMFLSILGDNWIGAWIFTTLWQPLVLTGMHNAILMPIMTGASNTNAALGDANLLLTGTCIAVVGQAGAATAVALRTKSAKTKQIAVGSMPAAFFGVTEPAIYGVNLPKVKPFLLGSVAAGLGAIFAGVMGVKTNGGNASMGLLFIATFVTPEHFGGVNLSANIVNSVGLNVLFGVLSIVVGAGSGFLLVFFTYKDRINDKKAINKVNKKLAKIYFLLTHKKLNWNNVSELSGFIDKDKNDLIRKTDNILSKVEKLDVKVENLLTKEESEKDVLLIKLKKSLSNEDLTKANIIKDKIEKIDYSKQVTELENKKSELMNERNNLVNQLENMQDEFLNVANNKLTNLSKELNYSKLIDLNNDYFNAIHSVDILYQLTKPMDDTFTKTEWKELKNLKKGKIN